MLEKNLKDILNFIESGNNLKEKITLVGATKTQSIETIQKAINLGLNVVAENRVQEFREKTEYLKNCEQQFIGHLQTNKVKYIVGLVSLIQSVDSIHLAEAISEQAVKKDIIQDILVEVNIGGELSKSGINPENAIETVKKISKLQNIKVKGLMAMLPKSEDETLLKNLCLKMREIYDTLLKEGFDFKYLSVGMSHDYKIAIQNGSNMIRLGSSIFGQRV